MLIPLYGLMKLAQTSGMLLESMLTACKVYTPINHCLYTSGRRISAISAISTRGVEDVYLAEGGVSGDTFCDFIEKCLLPVLMPFNGSNHRSIVVIDNASIHHIDEVVQLVSSVGALLWFLPPYSPDLNPIEPVFSQCEIV